MDATEMFLIRHRRMVSSIAHLTEGLSDAQIRERVHPMVNPLAWLLWHIARAEDSSISLLVADRPEVLDGAWCARLNLDRRDAGTGMTMDEVVDLSTRVDLVALAEYGRAVAERTESVVASLRPTDLDEVVSPDRVRQVVGQLVAEARRAPLEDLWRGTSKGHFLVWLPLTHNYEHIGQADLIRGLLGCPGRL